MFLTNEYFRGLEETKKEEIIKEEKKTSQK